MFTHDIHTQIDIHADQATIWNTLLDLHAYDDWNPMLRNVKSSLHIGNSVSFEVLRDNKKALKLNATIIAREEEKKLSWKGGSTLLLSGHHYFRIEPLGKGVCRFFNGEHFTGIILPLVKPVLKDASSQYDAMNKALKERVEDSPKNQSTTS